MKLKKIIGNQSHWTLNKAIVKQIGLTETLVLQHIIDLSESAFKKKEIFQPIHEMSNELGISEYSIKQAVGKLKSMQLINVERKSVGFMNFYSVNDDKVIDLINNSDNSLVSRNQPTGELSPNSELDSTLSDDEINSLVDTNSTLGELKTNSLWVENCGTITNNTTNNTEQIIKTKNSYTKAEVELLIKDLVKLKNTALIESVLDDLESIGWDNVYQILGYEDHQKLKLKNLVQLKLGII